jgi:hypothetical protein
MSPRRIYAAIAAMVLTVGLSACSADSQTSAQSKGQDDTEQAFKQQSAAVPYPVAQLTDSLERRNLKEKLLRQNKPNSIGYVYILGVNGTAIGYFTIKGKVSSTQSQMTTTDLVVDRCSSSTCPVVVTAPGDDGSYGENEKGIFFFTTEGALVETSMDYFVSDQPLPVSAPKLNPPKA